MELGASQEVIRDRQLGNKAPVFRRVFFLDEFEKFGKKDPPADGVLSFRQIHSTL